MKFELKFDGKLAALLLLLRLNAGYCSRGIAIANNGNLTSLKTFKIKANSFAAYLEQNLKLNDNNQVITFSYS